jgi:Flp pilus assembly pilin Flp
MRSACARGGEDLYGISQFRIGCRSRIDARLLIPGTTLEEKIGMSALIRHLWLGDEGQDIAEYAVMLAVILVIVIGTVRLIGTNANTVFSQVASTIQ